MVCMSQAWGGGGGEGRKVAVKSGHLKERQAGGQARCTTSSRQASRQVWVFYCDLARKKLRLATVCYIKKIANSKTLLFGKQKLSMILTAKCIL